MERGAADGVRGDKDKRVPKRKLIYLCQPGGPLHVIRPKAMNGVDLTPLGKLIRLLFAEHGFLTIVCAFLVVMMVLQFYRFLKSIHPVLVPLALLVVTFILMLHWVVTRTEPPILKPAVDSFVRYVPLPTYQGELVPPVSPSRQPPRRN